MRPGVLNCFCLASASSRLDRRADWASSARRRWRDALLPPAALAPILRGALPRLTFLVRRASVGVIVLGSRSRNVSAPGRWFARSLRQVLPVISPGHRSRTAARAAPGLAYPDRLRLVESGER